MTITLPASTLKLAFQSMKQLAKKELHPTAEVVLENGMARILLGKLSEAEEAEMPTKLTVFRARALGEAINTSADLIRALMQKRGCIDGRYFNIIMDQSGSADIAFDVDALKADKISMGSVRKTKGIFERCAKDLERSLMITREEVQPN